MTITGSGFGTKKGKILIGRTPLTVLEWTNGTIRGRLTKVPAPGTYDVTIQPVESKGAVPIVEQGGFMVKVPEILSISPNPGSVGDQITFYVRPHGTKKGKVSLGYESKGKPVRAPLMLNPQFAHVPMLRPGDGRAISVRQVRTPFFQQTNDRGYPPELLR